jgi:two-component system cell cycle sensor histidine kinase/response regulator CckA
VTVFPATVSQTCTPRRRVIEILVTAIAYQLGAHVGFLVQSLGTNTTPVWPPSGIAFAALLFCGYRVWPGIYLGALGANLVGFVVFQHLSASASLLLSLSFAAGNTLEGVSGRYLLHRLAGTSQPFERNRSVWAFLVVIPLMCAVAASTGAFSICLQGLAGWQSFAVIWFTWWLGDATGVLVVTPLLVVWARPIATRVDANWRTEGVLLVAGMLLACAVIFGIPFSTRASNLPLTFLLLPFFVWAAYRFEHRGATLSIAAASLFSVWAVVGHSGPFLRENQNDSLLLVQGFIFMVAVTTLVLAAEVHERRQAAEAFRASQEALLQSHKMEAVGRLAGGIAHDFNNLLQVILGHASMLQKHHPRITKITEAADRGAGLVRQLLAYSRQQVLDPSNLDLNLLVRGTGDLLRPLLGDQIELRIRTWAERLTVHADRVNLERVILNLALNSRDAMPDGGSLSLETDSVTLDAERARRWDIPPGSYARVIVKDDGFGIDAEVVDKIFDPFYTTKNTNTGLGLATAIGIVRQSSGHIEVRTESGKGSRFFVYLPRVPGATDPPPIADPVSLPLVAATKILLAEDNAEVRESIGAILGEHGYEVITARDGEEAFRLYQECGSELAAIVSDIMMPRMTGTDLVRRIKERDSGARVLLMSGYSREVSLQLPDTVYIQKPFTSKQLLIKLADLLAC